MEYLISFLITIVATYICQQRRCKFGWYILALQPIILVAALRSVNIGTDTHVYIYPEFYEAKRFHNLNKYIDRYFASGYLLVNYGVSRISSNVHVFLYVLHSIMYGSITYALYRHRDKLQIWVGVFILCFVFYRESLNTARQFAALGFDVLAFSFMLDRKWIKVAICMFVGFEFHHSALLFISIPLLIYLIEHYFQLFKRFFFKFVFVLAIVSVLLSFSFVLENIFAFGFIEERYLGYADDTKFGSNIPISLLALYFVSLVTFYLSKGKKNLCITTLFEYILIVSFTLCFSALISTYTVRIMSYFGYLSIIIFPLLLSPKKYVSTLYLSFLVFYWYMTTIVALLGGVYPYEIDPKIIVL